MIPTRIIQTGKGRALSPLAKASAKNLQLLHPDWEYCYFDDADIRKFIRAEFPQYEPVFDGFPKNIQRIDFFRYLAVYRLGGFYFDLDVLLSEPLDELLECDAVFTFEELSLNTHLRVAHGLDWEIGNYAFGAAPNHPYLGSVIDNCIRAQREPEWSEPMMRGIPRLFAKEFTVLNTTGPGLLTRTLAETQPENLTILFPDDVCDSANWHQFGHFGVHLMDGSWRDKGGYLFRRAACWWESRVRKHALIESQQRGPRRSFPAGNQPAMVKASIPAIGGLS